MDEQSARRIFERLFAPVSLDAFLDDILDYRFVKLDGSQNVTRADLLGPDPAQTILQAFGEIAQHIGSHAADPLGPPPRIEPVADATTFHAKIAAFHALGYTVRLPQPRWLSAPLGEFLRALEFLFHKPATAEAFWSRGDAKAPVHHDDYDIIVVQLRGRKRWFISTGPSELPNDWPAIPTGLPSLGAHQAIDVGPGDLLYLPRGTKHRVDALADSIHLSIGFVPLTLREALIAAVDHASEFDRSFRAAVGGRLSGAIRQGDLRPLFPKVRLGAARLAELCASQDFVAAALQRRSSRAIADLKPSSPPASPNARVTLDSKVRQAPLGMAHVITGAEKIDFSQPGEHIYIHRGAEDSVRFIASTPQFRPRDLPGAIGEDVRVALVERFLASGFLELAPE